MVYIKYDIFNFDMKMVKLLSFFSEYLEKSEKWI